MNIRDWIAGGKKTRVVLGKLRPVIKTSPGSWQVILGCSALDERQASVEDREAYYTLRPGCRSGFEATEGLPYSPGHGAFVGSGVAVPPEAFIPVSGAMTMLTVGQPALPGIDPRVVKSVDWGAVGGWIWDEFKGWIGGNGQPPPPPGTTGFVPTTCPDGYAWDAASGTCKATGMQGWIPGGQPGYLPATGMGCSPYGEAVMGAFNKPAMVPAQCQLPTLRCPPGSVLGKDNLCYDKGSISNANRKWPRPTRPLLTSGDMSVLRKANALESRLLRAYKRRGFPVMKKPPAKK